MYGKEISDRSLDILEILVKEPNMPLSAKYIFAKLAESKKLPYDTPLIKKYRYICLSCNQYSELKFSLKERGKRAKKEKSEPCGKTKEDGNRCTEPKRKFEYKGVIKVPTPNLRKSRIINLQNRHITPLLKQGIIKRIHARYILSKEKDVFKSIATSFHLAGRRKEFLISAYALYCLNKYALSLIRDKFGIVEDHFKDVKIKINERVVKDFIAYFLSSPTAFEIFLVSNKKTNEYNNIGINGFKNILENCVTIDSVSKEDYIDYVEAVKMVFGQWRRGYD